MLSDLLPFQITVDSTAIAGISLWSLALYLSLSSLSTWVMEQLLRWFNFAERSLYTSAEEFERTRRAREAQNAFYASLFSIVPFLILGGVLTYGLDLGLGRSWTISLGILTCVGCGVYELGRRSGNS